ncbi:Nitrogen assimilation regulatory protein [Gimesia chilikensis]|uniref:DNA-binding transcriptional regulator NtrC n=2 Tax=Gimesia TaxID=1649453 RepID=A0A6I6AH02_9PLAN|nr:MULTISPECIES: sigma-54 dependent transcriptional regulator [Gimesia]QDU05483.1 Nitrogen assimilation regulatory protein [Gimesia chilikensis]QGQ24690.1 sigma-54-dependent Fis family transcriptional regulator [Gimesia benthica]
MARLLIIDDEPNLLYSLRKTLQDTDLEIITAETGSAGINLVKEFQPDTVILDVRLPDMSGLDVFNEIRLIDKRLPVIIFTAHSTTETAIEATKRGAFDYLLKPVQFNELREIMNRALEISRMSHVPTLFGDTKYNSTADTIIGRSSAMQKVYKAIGRAAPQDITVLIQGESGTGKEMVAKAIYHHSQRRDGPFMAINCASIPDALLESELFGYERGAFTGADHQRVGKYEQVDGGTLFLDEIGDMSPSTQAKVLRLLQDGSFERVGSNKTVQSDVRIISATNRDLYQMVESGEFRRDLYYRLNVFSIELPPLRQRIEDIPALVEYFIKTAGTQVASSVRSITEDALEILMGHDWPGNVRELQSTIKHCLIQSVGELITRECLPSSCLCKQVHEDSTTNTIGNLNSDSLLEIHKLVEDLLSTGEEDLHRKVHSEIDRILLPCVLGHVDGSQAQAAKILGVARSTLRNRIEDLGISIEKRILTEEG